MESEKPPLTRSDRVYLAVLYGIPVLANLHVISAVLVALWHLPPGTNIRPMGLSCFIGLIGIATPILGIVLALLTTFLKRNSPLFLWSGFLCALLSCTPFFTGLGLYRLVVWYHALIEVK